MSFEEFYLKYRPIYRVVMYILIVVTIGYWVSDLQLGTAQIDSQNIIRPR